MVESAGLPIKLVRQKGSDGSGETEANGEPSYTNCLLLSLAKSLGAKAILKSGQAVPHIESISPNPSELPWIRGLPFDYGKLNTDAVIRIILGVFKANNEITARMVLSDGKTEMVRFQIKRAESKDKLQQIEIRRIG
jgi:hypothetical protein